MNTDVQSQCGIEGDADDTNDRGLELLYQKAKDGDALEFIRGSEIYKHLEYRG